MSRFYLPPSYVKALTRSRRASAARTLQPPFRDRVMVDNRHCIQSRDGRDMYFDDLTGKQISRYDIEPCTHRPACFTEKEHEYLCAIDDRDCQIRAEATARAQAAASRAYDPYACTRDLALGGSLGVRRLSRPLGGSFVPGRGFASRRAQEEILLNELARPAFLVPPPFVAPFVAPPVVPAPFLPAGLTFG